MDAAREPEAPVVLTINPATEKHEQIKPKDRLHPAVYVA